MNPRVIEELTITTARNIAVDQIDKYGRCFNEIEIQCIINECQYRLLNGTLEYRIISIIERIFKKWEKLLQSETAK